VHGTTVALNALLTGRGTDRAALVTNEGFQDLIEIDRQARPDLYDPEPVRPAPLVGRERRFELAQRSAPDPDDPRRIVELRAPTEAEIDAVCDAVAASGAVSAAVCLLHSYADPEPERRVVRALEARGIEAVASADLVAEYREAERFSTAVVNAALVPVVRDYLGRLGAALPPTAGLEVLQSSGGGLPAERAAREPVRVLLSGPAGGVVGAARAAERAGLGAFASLDMGGTSTDVAFHDPALGLASLAEEVRAAGHSIAVPTLDMHTIGCGGGSLARRSVDGALRVGPESAGADPGPVAFGRGGDVPTVTDAYVVLGRIPHEPLAEGFLGGALRLDVARAESAYAALGTELGTDAIGAAEAVVDAANAAMRRALGVMTMQRGRDPRSTPLVAFGGGGGLAAADLVRSLGMPGALVPDATGVLSAAGMTAARRTVDRSRTLLETLTGLGTHDLDDVRGALAADALAALGGTEGARVETSLAMRYRGQSYELPIAAEAATGGTPRAELAAAFTEAHRARFGWTLDGHPIEVVHVRVRASVAPPGSGAEAPLPRTSGDSPLGVQRVRSAAGALDAPVLARAGLAPGATVAGPAIVVDPTATTWVPPDFSAEARASGLFLARI
ncbi:MAG: hydantoinase/oxoprolinase family protein, partial [Planctomycetota bacterium]